jgi:hypothetical protein
MLSLADFRSRLRGHIDGEAFRFRDPFLPANYKSKRRRSRYDNSCAVLINPKGHHGFMVHSFRGTDCHKLHRWVCEQMGLEPWKPKPKGPRKPFRPWIDYYAPTRRLCLDRGTITQEQFAILVNDIIETEPKHRAAVARTLAAEFGFSNEEAERLAALAPRPITAEERSSTFRTTLEEHKRLYLNRIGCFEFDKATRRRMTRDRENQGRKAVRLIKRNFRAALKRVKSRTGAVKLPTVGKSSLALRVLCSTKSTESWVLSPRISESTSGRSKTSKIDAKKPAAPPELCPESVQGDRVPFGERVQLIMQHMGWSRQAAELEALRWLT